MPELDKKTLRLLMSIPHADSINAIGQFNNWSTVATPLTQVAENIWELQVPPEVEIERVGFFVIAKGAFFGRVINHADLRYA
jgi:1,4-alpha-glucan branching enzyme